MAALLWPDVASGRKVLLCGLPLSLSHFTSLSSLGVCGLLPLPVPVQFSPRPHGPDLFPPRSSEVLLTVHSQVGARREMHKQLSEAQIAGTEEPGRGRHGEGSQEPQGELRR